MMEPADVLNSIRDIIAAAEKAGWDTNENHEVLDKAREAYASLKVVMVDAVDDEVAF